jgi:universal stress protein A
MYKHILLAVDLPANRAEVEQAIQLAKQHNARLTVLHVIEHINAYGVAQAYPTVLDLEAKMLEDAKKELEKLHHQESLSNATFLVDVGSPKVVILQRAEELGVDLIVVGSHGRHGLALLLGSTANAILHHAPCDVLAVRIKE